MKVSIKGMLEFYSSRAVRTDDKTTASPPKSQAGYVMGGDGRVATDDYIRSRAKQSYGDSWAEYYNAYKKWLGHEVYDCNAIAESYYKGITGTSIDTKAKYNYSNWCSKKSSNTADKSLKGLPQMPGVAVFSGGNTASEISHVGFLYEKFGDGDLDWLVLECRGKDYGLVITTLTARPWAYWGVMDKYFEYEKEETMPIKLKITSPMMKSDAICELQEALNRLGYNSGETDGVCGKKTMAAIAEFCKVHTTMPVDIKVEITADNARYTGTIKKE